jgi:hypothetical protein
MWLNVSIITLMMVGTISCGGTKSASSGKQDKMSNSQAKSKPAYNPEKQYPVKVSFISIGTGIDLKLQSEFEAWLKDYFKKEAITTDYFVTYWGREGETDYCFEFNNLNAGQMNSFRNAIKTFFHNKERVHVEENSHCRGNLR